MNKQPIQVILGKDTLKGAPGALGRSFYNKAGESFHTRIWFYPGEPFESGSIGALMGHTHDEWVFWTGADIDFSLIFDETDVSEVVIPDDPEIIAIFKDAPFKVTIKG